MIKKLLSFFKKKAICLHQNRTFKEHYCWNGYEGEIYYCEDCQKSFLHVTELHWDGMTGPPSRSEIRLLVKRQYFIEVKQRYSTAKV